MRVVERTFVLEMRHRTPIQRPQHLLTLIFYYYQNLLSNENTSSCWYFDLCAVQDIRPLLGQYTFSVFCFVPLTKNHQRFSSPDKNHNMVFLPQTKIHLSGGFLVRGTGLEPVAYSTSMNRSTN